jgi:hypothetical protein
MGAGCCEIVWGIIKIADTKNYSAVAMISAPRCGGNDRCGRRTLLPKTPNASGIGLARGRSNGIN